MKKIFIVLMAWIFALIACGKETLPPQGKSENPAVQKVIVEKEKMGKVQPLPPEVKIKLKKDGKDGYSLTVLCGLSELT
jgi:hypothetical protein